VNPLNKPSVIDQDFKTLFKY